MSPDQNNKWQAKDTKKKKNRNKCTENEAGVNNKCVFHNLAPRCIFMKGTETVACQNKKESAEIDVLTG